MPGYRERWFWVQILLPPLQELCDLGSLLSLNLYFLSCKMGARMPSSQPCWENTGESTRHSAWRTVRSQTRLRCG